MQYNTAIGLHAQLVTYKLNTLHRKAEVSAEINGSYPSTKLNKPEISPALLVTNLSLHLLILSVCEITTTYQENAHKFSLWQLCLSTP